MPTPESCLYWTNCCPLCGEISNGDWCEIKADYNEPHPECVLARKATCRDYCDKDEDDV